MTARVEGGSAEMAEWKAASSVTSRTVAILVVAQCVFVVVEWGLAAADLWRRGRSSRIDVVVEAMTDNGARVGTKSNSAADYDLI